MKHILVVDDTTTNLKFVEGVLNDKYKLTMAKSGERAIKYLEKKTVDLILLDLMMPEMDGFETFEIIKTLETSKNTPVVFLTADVDVENEIKGLKMGAQDFIRKPFVPEVMLNRINHILQLDDLRKNLENKVEEKTKQNEQMSFEAIATIASMIEAKDSYTKGHSVRVAEYSAILATELGWEADRIQNLKYVALLHDIGKVGIPDSVLNKPGKLTEIEFNIIKSHTTIGGDILKEIETIPDVALGARYHHEKYDGSGYPSGLAGDNIPLLARIICIADAYDAMNSKRIYRDSLSKEAIFEQFKLARGKQFDPELLDIFVNLLIDGKLNLDSDKDKQKKTISTESSELFNQIMKNIEEENQKNEERDFLTGLLNRKCGEIEIAKAIKEKNGCLAFIDLDNLKKTNDVLGHLAGDYAIKSVGDVLLEFSENAIISRIGGDEYLYYMVGADKEKARETIENIINAFKEKKKESTYLGFSSLSIGACTTNTSDNYADVLHKTDKALYHVKQSGKEGYYFHKHSDATENKKVSIDLKKLLKSLEKSGSYEGTFSVEYREFAKIYDFIQNLVNRYNYDMQLIMITIEPLDYNNIDIDEQEYAMSCMEKTIKESLRNIDVCTRFSSEQFLIVFFNAEKDAVSMITNRIFENFYKIYNKKAVNISYDVADLPNNK